MYAMKKYRVLVDDNYRHGDEKERTRMGEFDSREEAVAACKARVEDYFERIAAGKYSFKELWEAVKNTPTMMNITCTAFGTHSMSHHGSGLSAGCRLNRKVVIGA